MIKVVNEDKPVNLCLDAGVPLAGGRIGVAIMPYASSQSAIQLIGDGSEVCA